jgi:hypothetical protein
MSKRNSPMTLFDRLRRSSALRGVLVVAAMLASQNSLACAFEEALVAQGGEIVASEEGCCNLCLDCANCGVCHGSVVSPRAGGNHLSFRSSSYAKITVETTAPTLWTPPALLRPPISAA